jgi:hypothetical protein
MSINSSIIKPLALFSCSTTKVFFGLFFLFLPHLVDSQTTVTILKETFNNITSISSNSGWTTTSTTDTCTWTLSTVNASAGYTLTLPSGTLPSSGTVSGVPSASKKLVVYNRNSSPTGGVFDLTYVTGISTVGLTNIKVYYGARRSGSAANDAVLKWSADGSTWTAVSLQNISPTAAWVLANGNSGFTLPASAEGVPCLRLRWSYTQSASNSSANYSIDDVVVTGDRAGTVISSIAAGNWSSGSTWSGGSAPSSSQDVYINSLYPVTIDNASAVCRNIDFDPAGSSGLLIMGSASSALTVYGDFNLRNSAQLVFSSWPAGAKLRFSGSASTQTLTGFNTGTINSGGIMELEVDKSSGKLATSGGDMALPIGTNLNIISGTFELTAKDDIYGRNFSGTATTPTINIESAGVFSIVSGTSQINSGTSACTGKIGKLTIYGRAELSTTSTAGSTCTPTAGSALNFDGIDVENGGILRLLSGWPASQAAFNPLAITVKSGGTLRYSTSATTYWNPLSSVVMNSGSTLNITTTSAPTLPPSFTDNGATWSYNYAGTQTGIGITSRAITNLDLAGGGIKTLADGASIIVNGTLSLSDTTSTSTTLSLGVNSALTYGSAATLQYGNASQTLSQTTTSAEWPASGSQPANVRIQNTGGVTLSGPRTITGNLDLVAGKINLGDNAFTVGSVSGGSSTSYVATTGNGTLAISSVGATATPFPVGNSAYNPVSITNNTGTSDKFSVRVMDAVYLNGNSGTTVNTPRVNRTWDIAKTNSNGGSGVDFSFVWDASEEQGLIGGYRLNHHNGSSWEFASGNSSAPSGSTTKTMTHRGYLSSFSPFSISDNSIVLPIVLNKFQCAKQGQQAILTWSTVGEDNGNKGFDVQRSVDGINFLSLGFVPAHGIASGATYQFLDVAPKKGVNFYRLKQEDFDGKTTFSAIHLLDFNTAFTVDVFPNPVRQLVRIQLSSDTGLQNIQLFDMQGRILRQWHPQQCATFCWLNLEGLPAGHYQLMLRDRKGNFKSNHIVKQ